MEGSRDGFQAGNPNNAAGRGEERVQLVGEEIVAEHIGAEDVG